MNRNKLQMLSLKDFLDAGMTQADWEDHLSMLETESGPEDTKLAERSAKTFSRGLDRITDVMDLASRGAERARSMGFSDRFLELSSKIVDPNNAS